MADIVEVDAVTGDLIERDYTQDEAAQRAADLVADAQRRLVTDQIDSNRTSLTAQAAASLEANRTFLAIVAPTQAQTLAQVKALTRQTTALIRLQLNQLDAAD